MIGIGGRFKEMAKRWGWSKEQWPFNVIHFSFHTIVVQCHLILSLHEFATLQRQWWWRWRWRRGGDGDGNGRNGPNWIMMGTGSESDGDGHTCQLLHRAVQITPDTTAIAKSKYTCWRQKKWMMSIVEVVMKGWWWRWLNPKPTAKNVTRTIPKESE